MSSQTVDKVQSNEMQCINMSKHIHFSLWHCKAESNSVKGKRLSRAPRPMTGLCSAFCLVIKRQMNISALARAMELPVIKDGSIYCSFILVLSGAHLAIP